MANTSIFQFLGYKIIKSHIDLSDVEDNELNVAIDLKGTINKIRSTFDLVLDVTINNKTNTILIDICALGNFSFPKEKEINDLSNYFYMNAPALLFPYIRAYIATLTNLSGIDAINLETLNLTQYGKILEQQTTIIIEE